MTTNHVASDELMAWRDGEIDAARSSEIAAHVRECAECARVADQFSGVHHAMAAWKVEPPPAMKSPAGSTTAAGSKPSSSRRWWYAASAAAVVMFLLTTVRVECSPAPACDLRTAHFSFMRHATEHSASAAPGQTANTPAQQAAFERDWMAKRRVPVGAPATTAQVVVVIYLDWQCPACRAVDISYLPVIDAINAQRPGSVLVLFRDYPLNMKCNPNVPVELHPAACEAAVAVRLAKEKHLDAQMIKWLFDNQPSLTPASVIDGAKRIAGITDFTMRAPGVLKDIAKDVESGRGLEVGSTPTVFVNGVLARGEGGRLLSPLEFSWALQAEGRKRR